MINLKSLDGRAAGMMVADIASLHRVPVKQIEEQIRKGIKIEMEHTNDEREAEVIAMDHLVEIPDYYDRLIKMEKEAGIKDAKMKDGSDQYVVCMDHWDPDTVYVVNNQDSDILDQYFGKDVYQESIKDYNQLILVENDDEHINISKLGPSMESFRQEVEQQTNKALAVLDGGEVPEEIGDYFEDGDLSGLSISIHVAGDIAGLYGYFDPKAKDRGADFYSRWLKRVGESFVDNDSDSQLNIVNLGTGEHVIGNGAIIFFDDEYLENAMDEDE